MQYAAIGNSMEYGRTEIMSTILSNRFVYLAASATVLLGLITPTAHAARTFCCADEKNQQRCGDVLPESCRSRAYVEYNEAGIRVRSIARPLTEAEQAVRDAEEKKKRELADVALQQQRADQALLSTYADEKDLETARDRALVELDRSVKSAEENLVELNKSKVKFQAETEFYKNKPLPPELNQKQARNQAAIAEQQATMVQKKKEIEETKAKFEGFSKRLQELKSSKDKAEKP
jgi:chromosome segregation ATPase